MSRFEGAGTDSLRRSTTREDELTTAPGGSCQEFYEDFDSLRPTFAQMYAQRKAAIEGRTTPKFRHYHIFKELGRIQAAKPIRSVLEVGTGNGVNLALVHDMFGVPKCMGTDIIPRSPEMPAYIEYSQIDVTRIHDWVPPSSVSVVLMIEVIEHLVNPDAAIEEVRDALEPGGRLVITTPNLSSGVNRIALMMGYQPLGTEVSTRRHFGSPVPGPVAGHLRVFTFRSLLQFAKHYGFVLDRAYSVPLGGGLVYPTIVSQRGPGSSRSMAKMVVLADRFFSALNSSLGNNTVAVFAKPAA